ncbi:hypothetical protein GQ42DRAFT_170571 [Ramicandelaber brevisporus]|nr:hypothetical protein GQ42DRAFT_170571 [Ramicandelaber brevisporus]
MSDFDPGIEIEMVAGTPSPGEPSVVADAYTIITSTTAITTSTTASTFTSLSVPTPSAASLDASSNRETLSSSPPPSSAIHQPQSERQSTRSTEDADQESISHEHIESLFHCQQMIDIQWQGNIDLVPKYLSSYHP